MAVSRYSPLAMVSAQIVRKKWQSNPIFQKLFGKRKGYKWVNISRSTDLKLVCLGGIISGSFRLHRFYDFHYMRYWHIDDTMGMCFGKLDAI